LYKLISRIFPKRKQEVEVLHWTDTGVLYGKRAEANRREYSLYYIFPGTFGGKLVTGGLRKIYILYGRGNPSKERLGSSDERLGEFWSMAEAMVAAERYEAGGVILLLTCLPDTV
jgi:hypothetical protein